MNKKVLTLSAVMASLLFGAHARRRLILVLA